MSPLKPGAQAPAFTLPRLDGGELSLATMLAEGEAVFVFFKVSCPICQYSLPYYDRLAALLADKKVPVIGISQDNADHTALFRRSLSLKLPLLRDDEKNFAASRAYGLTTVPTAISVGTDGTINTVIEGWSKADFEQLYDRFTAPGAPPVFRPDEEIAAFRAG